MVNIQQLVNHELENNPFLVELLQQQLINVSAVAVQLVPTIEKGLKKKIKLSAVSMAIRRYTIDRNKAALFHWKFPKNLEIATKSQIYEVAFERTAKISFIVEQLFREIKLGKGEFLSIIEGTYEIAVFTNQKNKQYVKKAIKSQIITSELDNLAYITVNWEKITKDIPGIYYRITRALAFKNISIQSFHTIGAEMMIFIKEDNLAAAHQVITNLLYNKSQI